MTSYDHRDHHDDSSKPGLNEQAERFGKRVTESAQQVWLAGLGALSRAQSEGGKLFDNLVKEGESWEERSRQESARGESLRDTVENTVDSARERAAGTWDRVEKSFDDKVQRVLQRLQIPSRNDVERLNDRLDALNARLNRAEARAATVTTPAGTETSGPPSAN